MKIRKRTEPDLYVVNKPFTRPEKEELSLIIKNYKKNHKIKYPKIKPAAAIKAIKKYEVVETNLAFAREPEPDLYVINKPLTKKDQEEITAFIQNYKKKQKIKTKPHLPTKRLK